MNKSKTILIAIIVILCVGLVVGSCVAIFGGKEDNKTIQEVYNELPENEKQQVKDQYEQFKDGKLDILNPETEVVIPDAIKDKVIPPSVTNPIEDFINGGKK